MNEETNSECEAPSAKRFKLDESDSLADESRTEPGEFADSKYDNFVTPEELEKLKEFQVLDEVKSNDEDSNDEDSESSDGKSEGLPEDEIEKMLEEDLPDGFKGAPKQKERPYITRQKIVLEEKGVNHFEVLPLDWMMVRHYSGMPVYMHRATRVCTLSKPYFLGKGNTRRHDIPISAIPCYSYRRALEEEVKQKEIDRKIEEQIKNGTWATNGQTTEKGASEKFVPDKIPSENIVVDKIAAEKMVADKMAAENMVTEEMATDKEDSLNKDSDKTSEIKPDFEVAPMKCPFRSRVNGNDADSGPNNVDMKEVQNADENNETGNMDVTENGVVENGVGENGVDENGICENGVDNGVAENGEANKDVEIPLNRQPVVLPGGIVMPPPRVETVNTSWKTQHLTHEQVNGYCKKLFKFKTVNIMHFKRWADRRKYTRARKTLQYPTLPEGTKLITIPAQPSNGSENGGKSNKRDWVMNMNGRSYLSVFHEYVRRALQKQPVYEFVQLENASTPYQATVYIGGMQYGVGHGSSKRQAKSAAARASIHILIPEMRDELDAHAPPAAAAAAEPDFSFFDYVSIEDPRITEFCAATCEPSPHAILRTCLLRNFGAGDRHIQTEMKKLEYQKIELTMKVGKHTATVVCKNKKTAKQRASQAILQALHPHVRSWGSLLRLYGSRSVKSCKEKKLEEQQITLLQDKARHNEPNHAVLAKLRAEMDKLRARDAAVVPIGTLSLRATLPTHSGANLNNVDL